MENSIKEKTHFNTASMLPDGFTMVTALLRDGAEGGWSSVSETPSPMNFFIQTSGAFSNRCSQRPRGAILSVKEQKNSKGSFKTEQEQSQIRGLQCICQIQVSGKNKN
jgi:hypothetical protein